MERWNQKWKSIVARKVMEVAKNYQEAEVMLLDPKMKTPAYFILDGCKTGQVCIMVKFLVMKISPKFSSGHSNNIKIIFSVFPKFP